MPLIWYTAGALSMLAILVILLPWLRKLPRCSSLPLLPWQASVGAAIAIAAVVAVSAWLQPTDASLPSATFGVGNSADRSAGAFGNALKVFDNATGAAPMSAGQSGGRPANGSAAGAESMDAAIASLEGKLAKGGGTADDWELLAKAFEFEGRPADAAKARARHLPSLGASPGAAASSAAAGGVSVSGEINLAASLAGKAAAGETLFIVAKSVDSPGIPVAVFRGSVGKWPLKFHLDDSQSMIPGRNLSSAGRVTIEARISRKGQPLPSAGDLQGSSGAINPADRKPLKVVIDKVIS